MLKRWADWPRCIRWLAVIAVVVLALAIVWALFVPLADWLAHHDVGSAKGSPSPLQTARDAARGRLLTLGAGLLAAGALLFTALNFWLSRAGQVTDRYTKAIEQLGSDKLGVRIGGIYALERIARDSARDHLAVMDALTAFIREYPNEPWIPLADDEPGIDVPGFGARGDIQAAVTVIGRRNPRHDQEKRLILYRANLSRADISRADLGGAYLVRARLVRADLQRAKLQKAIAARADFTGANLTGANLTGANLYDVNFNDANLTDVKWPAEKPVPQGWELDTRSGGLKRAGTDSGPAETD